MVLYDYVVSATASIFTMQLIYSLLAFVAFAAYTVSATDSVNMQELKRTCLLMNAIKNKLSQQQQQQIIYYPEYYYQDPIVYYDYPNNMYEEIEYIIIDETDGQYPLDIEEILSGIYGETIINYGPNGYNTVIRKLPGGGYRQVKPTKESVTKLELRNQAIMKRVQEEPKIEPAQNVKQQQSNKKVIIVKKTSQ